MLFNSMHFAFFFVIVTTFYFLIGHRYRWFLLLAASCYFYMVFVPVYILILGFTIVIDYFAAIFIEKTVKHKRNYLILSLIANIGILAVFKYYNFINDNITSLLGSFSISNPIPYLSILLPIGLSFHTFQAMSYTIEVYRGNQKAEKNFGIYALYVMFYPQLVAGPIERPQNLLHQFYEKHDFDYERVKDGLKLMLWGLFKKVVIADRLALYVNAVYNNSDKHSGLSLLLATVFFAFQIYCDFSGYSDIAIGSARVMGIKLMKNFNHPYFSKSISEFWSRWHISLSTWFKDYLYIPLGGNRVSIPRWYFNLFFVFLVSGLWHGANWTFIIWGSINGLYLVFAIITSSFRTKFKNLIGIKKFPLIEKLTQLVITFALCNLAWIFFRARDVQEAMSIITRILKFDGPVYFENPSILLYGFMGILFLVLVEAKKEFYSGKIKFLSSQNWAVRNLSYAMLIILILLFGVFDGGEFIYFQF